MEPFEFFGSLVELNLGSLGLGDFLFKLVSLLSDLNSELFDLKGKFLDFGLICSSILLKSEVIFLLLSGSEGPLLQLLLIPVHFKLELIHLLISLEDHVLDVVESILLVGNPVIQFFYLILQPSSLSFSNLLHVLFSLDFLVFSIDKGLGMNELHLNGL
jgi:hypothetical protein